jgi:integrase
MAGVDLVAVKELLGHKDIKMTILRYAHLATALKKKAVKVLLDTLLNPSPICTPATNCTFNAQ